MKNIIFFLLCLTACGGFPQLECVQSFQAGGMTFCLEKETDNINKDMVEDLVAVIEQEVRKRYPNVASVRDMLQNNETMVFVQEATFVYNCQEVYKSGFYICESRPGGFVEIFGSDIFISVPKNNNCFADKLLAHEILHLVNYYFLEGDNMHDKPFLFQRTDFFKPSYGPEETIEYQINQVINNDLIPLYPEQCE